MTSLRATRFMRMPFIVEGYRVTDENMETIARWCQGQVIRPEEGSKGNRQAFIRVPVDRATKKWMSEAFVGMWVVVSMTYRGEPSFKIYTQEWLERTFFILPDEIDEEEPAAAAAVVPITPPTGSICCAHNHAGSNVRALPKQGSGPRITGNIRSIN